MRREEARMGAAALPRETAVMEVGRLAAKDQRRSVHKRRNRRTKRSPK
jgi:hypothetical protein